MSSATGSLSVRDSAGVRIVEYGMTPDWASPRVLAIEPLYRHGHRPVDHQFAYVTAGVLLDDGRVVVVDNAGTGPEGVEVLLISGAAQSVITLARGGQGPGEVRSVNGLGVLGSDTVLVEDDGNGRIMLFAGADFDRSISLGIEPSLVRGLRTLGMDEAGRALMTTSMMFTPGFDIPWLPGELVAVDLASLEADTVGTYDMVHRNERQDGTYDPFGYQGLVTVSAAYFVHARTDVPEIVWRTSEGTVHQLVRWVPDGRYPTEADEQLFIERREAEIRQMNSLLPLELQEQFVAQQLQQLMDDARMDRDSPMPLFGDIRGDSNGGVWLAEYQPGRGEPTEYYVVDDDGTWLGAVQMPPGFRLLDAREEYVLGVLTDELGVQSVAVFPMGEP